MQSKISDQELVSLLRNKDKKGINGLYQNHSRLLFGVILRIVKKQDIAENVMQEVFLKIWQNIESYNPSKGYFLAWAMNIARNAAIDMVRSKAYRKEQRTDEVVPSTAQQFSTEMKVGHIGVREVVATLDPKYKTLIDLLYFEGYTQVEVAEELDIPLGTVKSRVRKAFSELRSLLK
ncbi:MAG TPA: sigma-70 family RNA polymerase sigma factor [Bacteroidetes bacterium]|nr:sigma-70 family RNA polymerase sigma factor [Bacteroidota bacterium]